MKNRLTAPIARIALIGAMAATIATGALAQGAQAFGASRPISGQYIVVFKNHVGNPAAEAVSLASAHGGRVLHTYTAAVKGFAATLPDAAVQALRNNPNVDYVEQDQTISLSTTESGATWGIDRIDQVDRPLDTLYHYNYTGAGVYAFIIDTGILASHVEFTGRVQPGYTAISDGNGTNDCNGHGTHVSGTVAGTTWGVAKQASLVPVRVLDCKGSGSNSGVIAGVDWAANSALRPAVANMSLGGSFSSALNAAVAGAVSKGVTMAIAAGNSNADACNYSPASEPSAITVGATGSDDARASYSNYGTCVDLFAPGSGITSAWNTSSTATNTISGTSMATPHVTGVAALVTQANPGATPAAIANFIVQTASVNKVSSPGTGSPNLLLYSLGSGTATEPTKTVIAVKSIAGSKSRSGRNWVAKATVTMYVPGSGAAAPNVTVKGSFSPGQSGSCVTASNGSCTLSSGTLSSSVTSTLFSVTGATGYNMTYDASLSAIKQLTITKP
jgi:subtilisin family serine protease